MSPHEEQILNEQVAHQQRVISEAEQAGPLLPERPLGRSIAELQRRLRERLKCARCGKTRVVLNLAQYRRPWEIEKVTPETHCTCAPRVDPDGSRHSGGPAWELVSAECEHCDHGEIVEMFDGYPEKSICGMCSGIGRVPLPNARVRGPSTFEVIDRAHDLSHGIFDTLDEARGCVAFDRLGDYEIWQGDHIVEEPSQERAS